jgi:hypothetical protein
MRGLIRYRRISTMIASRVGVDLRRAVAGAIRLFMIRALVVIGAMSCDSWPRQFRGTRLWHMDERRREHLAHQREKDDPPAVSVVTHGSSVSRSVRAGKSIADGVPRVATFAYIPVEE